MNKYTIIPSSLQFKSAPAVDQNLSLSLEAQQELMVEYDRSATISLAQVFDDERQGCTVFRPTFKVTYLYDNTYTGTTQYIPFRNNLYYVRPEESVANGIWRGFPQYYEFDFYRPNISDQHVDYKAKSAYTYNWSYYLTYPSSNNYEKTLYTTLSSIPSWKAKDGIPFTINNAAENGSNIISFECVAPHGLTAGEFVMLSFSYNNNNLFEVSSLGNGLFESEIYIFNITNVGYTGTTFQNGVTGTFKRVLNPLNLTETTSKYYVREHKVITKASDLIVTKSGFEKNVFSEGMKLELSSITPDNVTRVSKKTSSNAYTITSAYDLDFATLVDNQKRPLTKLYLSIVFKGYTGYFNEPSNGIGIKQGWGFNITQTPNFWWDRNNFNSNTNIPLQSYVKTSGITRTFYYSSELSKDATLDGDFCEWNDYEQLERVVSPYYHKIKFNQDIFTTQDPPNTNAKGYYYQPHHPMNIQVFSDYIETARVGEIENVPKYSYYSNTDQTFRWRDLYTYGFVDNLGRGVDYPYLNSSHYPYETVIFRLIPEGSNYNYNLYGVDVPIKPLIDGCE